MIRAKSIEKMLGVVSMIDTIDASTPTGIQLVAADEHELLRCLDTLAGSSAQQTPPSHWQNISAIDLNFGCPKPDIVKYRLGPALLSSPQKMDALFRTMKQFKDSGAMPNLQAIGAKIRLGMDEDEASQKLYLPILEAANESLDFLTVHPRHAGLPVWDQRPDLLAVKEIVSLSSPALKIIANGDVVCPRSLDTMFKSTGCDAVMIARGAINNPWIFRWLLDSSQCEWPATPQEVDAAERDSEAWESRWNVCNQAHGGIKHKYVSFRKVNFQRIRHFVETGEDVVFGNEKVRDHKKDAHLSKGA
jgi:tRNA-dihydrouridine synthase